MLKQLQRPVLPEEVEFTHYGTVSPHLLEAGQDICTIQMLMGHSSILTTVRYLQVTQSPLDLLAVPSGRLTR